MSSNSATGSRCVHHASRPVAVMIRHQHDEG